jgi:hypothetical protein
VIQAAAPDGVSGEVRIGAPSLDIAGSLTGLSAELLSAPALTKDLCRIGAGSSLTPLGRGGLRPTSSGMIRPDGPIALGVGKKNPANAKVGFGLQGKI